MSAEHIPTALVGGRYIVRRLLGEGGRKRVYLAHDTRLERDVAIAVVKTAGLDAAGLGRVEREARAMARVGDHPHVVTVHDVGDDEGRLYIVSQYMAGGDVEGRLQAAAERRLLLADALRIGEHVCRALEHVHAHGVVHRDVKPANVWLAPDGTAKLGDFGLALAEDRSRLTLEGMMVGTVACLAPEQALGRGVEARTDLYALGALLYEMVTGRPPFVGDTAVAIVSQHLHTAPVAPSWHNPAVPPALDALVMRLLAKVPADRPASATAVREVLATIPVDTPAESAPVEVNPLERLSAGIFVGRDAELAGLRAGVEDAISGNGRVLLLTGDPGIGKTRTAEEVATYARLRGLQVLWGRCHEGEGAPAYWPWAQAIRAYVHERPPQELAAELGSGAREVAQVISAVRERLPDLPPPPQLEAQEARFRLFDSLTTFLKNAATHRPLLLVLDDLHWADPASLLLLQFVARESSRSRLVVLTTHRDVEARRHTPLFETLAVLTREPTCRRVSLDGLREAEVARFLELTAGRAPAAGLAAAVRRETEGNPFFMGEVVKLLTMEGRLDDVRALAAGTLGLPAGVREVIGRRLDRLSPECVRVLTIAAAVGREFGLELLQNVAALAPAALLEVMDEVFAARVVTEGKSAVGQYAFAHALIRETLYAELTAPRRAQLHLAIGEALETLHAGRLDAHLAELAHHFYEAARGGVEIDKVVGYAVRAAERATAMMAHEDAAAHYERALQAVDLDAAADELRRCELLVALGESRYKAGDRDGARAIFESAAEIARRCAAAGLLARAALGAGTPFVSYLAIELGNWDPALARMLEEALALLDAGDDAVRARLLACLANCLQSSPERSRSLALSDEAVTLARRASDPRTLVQVLYSRFVALWGPAQSALRLEVAREIVRVADAAGDIESQMSGRDWLSHTYFELGDLAGFEAEHDVYRRTAERVRQPVWLYHVAQWHAARALFEGRFEEAEPLIQETFAIGTRIGNRGAMQGFAAQMAELYRETGRLAELEAGLEQFVQRYPALLIGRCGLVLARCELGRRPEAQRELDRIGAHDFVDLPVDWQWLAAVAMLGEAAAGLGDRRRAAQLYELLRPYASRYINLMRALCYGSVSRVLGLCAATLSQWAEAARHFEDALRDNERLGARPMVAYTQTHYGEMLLSRASEGDGERGLGLLGRALETAQALGMKTLGERIVARKLALQLGDAAVVRTSLDAVTAAVARARPDLRPHAAPDGTVTILFTDLEDSTAMVERLGDHVAQGLLREHGALVRLAVDRHEGFLVKSQGDGFMVAFASARRAVLCAVALQRALTDWSAAHPETPMRIRIGIHTGEAIRDGDDYFGKNVILASRITERARGGEILVSSVLRDLVASAGDVPFGRARTIEPKGIAGTLQVFDVPWDREPRPVVAAPVAVCSGLFHREGAVWLVGFGEPVCRVKDVVGLHYLAHLLQHAGEESHVLELVRMTNGGALGSGAPPASDAGPVLDATAKAAYRRRLAELRDEVEEAERFSDLGRRERSQAEIEAITEQLAAAVGLGGRDRVTGATTERARSTVTHAIKAAIRRIRGGLPALGEHLALRVRTGTYCLYVLDSTRPVTWTF